MKKVLLVVILGLMGLCGRGQVTFQKTYGGAQDEVFYSVQQTNDGGYIMVGCTNSFGAGNYDVYLVKTDLNGDTLWTRTYGGTGREIGYCVRQTTDSGYIVIGTTGPSVYLIKTNINGDSLWTKTYRVGSTGESTGWSVKQTFDGGYILDCTGSSYNVAFLIKTNVDGDTLWTKSYGFEGGSIGEIQQTLDSGYIFIGTSGSIPSLYLVKTNVNGNLVWGKKYQGIASNEWHYGSSVQQTPDGGYIAVGSAWNSSWDVYLIKTNSFGDTLWTKSYGGDSTDGGSSIYLTADAGYIIAGTTLSFGLGGSDVYLIKTDSIGDTLWTKSYGGIYSDGSTTVQQTLDGGYILAGSANRMAGGSNDAYLIKTDANGNSGCYEHSTATIVSSPHTIVSLPVDTLIINPMHVNTYSGQVGNGGTITTLCYTNGVKELIKKDIVSIFPNPASTTLTLHRSTQSTNSTNQQLTITDVFGRIVYAQLLNQSTNPTESTNTTIDISNLSQGIYFYEVAGQRGKIVKN